MGTEAYIGEISMFAGNYTPQNWAFCDGSLLPISQNAALFSILGTIYGGDGRTTFALPDLRGRCPVGAAGTGPGLSPRPLGSKGGYETTTLQASQMPSHSHGGGSLSGTLKCNNSDAEEVVGAEGTLGKAVGNTKIYNEGDANLEMKSGSVSITGSTDSAGGSAPINNMPPFLGINYIICLQGIYPPRS
jgi:microcystin-dependent protein